MNDVRPPFPATDPPSAWPEATQTQADTYPRDYDDDQGGDLRELLWSAWDAKWLILAILAIATAAGVYRYLSTEPSYTANGLMQIETNQAGASALQAFEQYGEVLGGSVLVAAEIAVMKSRPVMSDVVERLNLDIRATPVYYPYFGRAIARSFRGPGVAKPWFGRSQYAWGGERIQVQSLLVPQSFYGNPLILEAGTEGSYRLLSPAGAELLRGETGARAQTEIDGEPLVIFVTRLKARAGTHFHVKKLAVNVAAAGLAESFSATERPAQSGILRASFTAGDPERAATVLNAIMENYQRRNLERKGEEADKTLAFLEKQLPPLQTRLEAAETAYRDYLREHGTIDITRETQEVLTSITEIDSELFTLQQERERLRARFKPAHPKIRSIDSLVDRLSARLAALEAQTESLPTVQQTVLRLKRDVEVTSGLYSNLINSLQELRIAKAGTVGNARIIEDALPPQEPVAPSLRRNLMISGLLGLVAAFGFVYLRVKLRRGIDDPDALEQRIGLPVLATIPFSQAQDRIAKAIKKRHKTAVQPLALQAPSDPAVESIRSLRTNLHFLLLEANNKTLLITGPTQEVGKSFLSLNLAILLAQAGSKVLLIDGDMRKGHLHRLAGVRPQVGLCEYLTGDLGPNPSILHLEEMGIDFLPAGTRPPNPADLLMHERFAALLESTSGRYDYVLIDAPPVLAVTDAAVIGQHGGATLMVARSPMNNAEQVEQSIKTLQQSGARTRGVILNGISLQSRYSYRYRYQYAYRYADTKTDRQPKPAPS